MAAAGATTAPKETTLDGSQVAIATKIIARGRKEGMSLEDIAFAVKVAFLESSLGKLRSNGIAGNTSTGLYQYNNAQWDASGAGYKKDSDDDQIAVFYKDIRKYTLRYNSLKAAKNKLIVGITLYQYIYIKHHDGPNYDKFADAPGKKLFDASTFNPPKSARADPIISPPATTIPSFTIPSITPPM